MYITFQFLQMWVCHVRIFESTPMPEICYSDYGLLNVMEFLHLGIMLQNVTRLLQG